MEDNDFLRKHNIVMESDWAKDQIRRIKEEKRRSGRDFPLGDMIMYGINCITMYQQDPSVPMYGYMSADGRDLISELLRNGIL